jgi:hypothetical protein
MKKLLLVLLVVTLASFLFVGCLPTTPAEGEGEGEGEGEPTVTVAIGDSVVLSGKTYVKGGSHSITVTFAEPVTGNVSAVITDCGGNYKAVPVNTAVVLFPDADKKVWTGSGTFGLGADTSSECCASYVQVISGECLAEVCIEFPVIVDKAKPFAQIKVTADECTCDSQVVVHFDSTTASSTCATSAACCGDDCSGLASWAIDIYNTNPFDICCDIPCVEPIASCSGVGCAVDCDTACLPTDLSVAVGCPTDNLYFVVTTLLDEVGNKTRYYAKILLDDALVGAAKLSTTAVGVTTTEYAQNKTVGGGAVSATNPYVCTDFVGVAGIDWAAVLYTYGNCSDTGDNIL